MHLWQGPGIVRHRCSSPQWLKTHKNNVKYQKGERLDFEFKARRKKFRTVEN